MTIRCQCPNPACRKMLTIADHLVGRKLKCPSCQRIFRLAGQPEAARPSAEVEELAADLLRDPQAQAETTPQLIRLECPYCAEAVEFPAELAGKQAPCPNPECRRILKVPVPASARQAEDWRRAGRQVLLGTKESVEKQREAEEAANIRRTLVSGEALREAGALAPRPTLLTRRERLFLWLRRSLLAALALGLLLAFWLGWQRAQKVQEQLDLLSQIEPWLDPKNREKLDPENTKNWSSAWQAALYRGLGEYYLRQPDPTSGPEARKKFLGVLACLSARPSWEEQVLLIDLLPQLLALAGTPEEVQEKRRLDWPTVQKDLGRFLARLPSGESKLLALREVTGPLIHREKSEIAAALAHELLLSKEKAGPADLIPALLQGELAALLRLGKKEKEAEQLAPSPKAEAPWPLASRLAQVIFQARQANFAAAQETAQQPGPPAERLHAFLALATIARQQQKEDVLDNQINEIIKIIQGELKSNPPSSLLLWYLTRLAAFSRQPEQAKFFADLIRDPSLQACAELEQLRRQLRQGTPPASVDETVKLKKSLAYLYAWQELTRFYMRQGQTARIREPNDLSPAERYLQPFLYLGRMLGEQDRNLGIHNPF
jgi:phage FluMu protein Com